MTTTRWMVMAFALLLAGCHGPSADRRDAGAENMALRIYDVPAEQTDALRRALDLALAGDKSHVSTPTPGKLLVFAPSSAQESIGRALSTLAKSAPATSATTLQAHFWVIDASAGSGPDDPQLTSLAAALSPLQQNLGEMQFQLDEAVASALVYGRPTRLSTVDGKIFSIVAMTSPGGALDLEVQYHDSGVDNGIEQLDTHVAARLGQTIVLAQAPRGCRGQHALTNGAAAPCVAKGLRLLVVRVDPLTAAH